MIVLTVKGQQLLGQLVSMLDAAEDFFEQREMFTLGMGHCLCCRMLDTGQYIVEFVHYA